MATVDQSFETIWTFITAILVFYMQTGFAMLEAGVVQKKNIKSILAKNTIDMCFAAISFWLFGFGLAFGCKDGCHAFIGNEYFALQDVEKSFLAGKLRWFYQFAFVATSSTIVSGCVAERMQFSAYCIFTTLMTSFIYPTVAHWVWGGGWLHERGMIDFAGGTVVHIVGGASGLVGAIMIGPRIGRFEGKRGHVTVYNFPSYSSVFGALGVLILWFGWYGFNCGSVVQFFGQERTIALIAFNTTVAAAAGVLCALALVGFPSRYERLNLGKTLNGALAGLVSITPCCAVVEPGFAFLIGAVGGAVYVASSYLLKQLKIDDPLDASPIHLFAAMWGMIATGLFAEPEKVRIALPHSNYDKFGLFYGDHNGELLAWELIGVLSVVVWSVGLSSLVFYVLSLFNCLRVSEETEVLGMDVMFHGTSRGSLPPPVQRAVELTST